MLILNVRFYVRVHEDSVKDTSSFLIDRMMNKKHFVRRYTKFKFRLNTAHIYIRN